MTKKSILSTALALGAGVTLALAVPLSASAHVGASADTTAAGSYAIVTISVPHGLDGAPTQSVAIEIPETIVSVTPTVNPNWVISETTEPLEPAVDDQTERISVVTYTAKDAPLDAHQRDTFQLSVRLDGEEGDVLEFRTTQTSPDGATVVWEGEEVPSITLTAAVEGGDAHDHGATEEAAPDSEHHAAADTSGDSLARGLGIGGLVLGAIGLVLGVTALRRKSAA